MKAFAVSAKPMGNARNGRKANDRAAPRGMSLRLLSLWRSSSSAF